jgi:Isochorismatase family
MAWSPPARQRRSWLAAQAGDYAAPISHHIRDGTTLLIAGTLTSVCMSFPTLSALVAGYKVFTIVDASGNWSKMATDITLARVVQAGAMPIDTYAVLAEVMSTWNRPDAMEFARVMVDHIVPPYRALMESYDKAQDVQKVGRETKLEAARAKTPA